VWILLSSGCAFVRDDFALLEVSFKTFILSNPIWVVELAYHFVISIVLTSLLASTLDTHALLSLFLFLSFSDSIPLQKGEEGFGGGFPVQSLVMVLFIVLLSMFSSSVLQQPEPEFTFSKVS
jgi:hypothetical protein